MGPCCVEGCTGVSEDIVYFEFPTSRGLRRKWLEMIRIPPKIPLGTVVCSQHFNRNDYETVRGKARLKRKVVPTLKLYNASPKQPSPSRETKLIEDTVPNEEPAVRPEIVSKTDTIPDDADKNERNAERIELREDLREEDRSEDICKVINKDSDCAMQCDRLTPIPDPKHQPDFEDMITNYQIKNSKPNTLLSEQIEIEVPPVSRDEAIELDGGGDAPPVFIEISVDKDSYPANTSNEDCLMVLESVQVDVDPATLMLMERDYDEESEQEQRQVEHEDVKKDDPISLLTSSDDDDVIIQEPHIDTVEVSDETDEDDMPLVKLVKKKPVKRKQSKKKTKKVSVNPEAIQNLIWSGVYGFYCIQCQYKTMDSMEYALHLKDHHKVMQVCHICNYSSASKTQFSRHARKHKGEKKFKCHMCEYRARHQMSLMYHMECHYKDEGNIRKPFKCSKCQYRADTRDILKTHMESCDGRTRFACDICFYASKRHSDLKRHVATVHKEANLRGQPGAQEILQCTSVRKRRCTASPLMT